MLKWLLQDRQVQKAEEELDQYLKRIERKVIERGDDLSIPVDVDFPDEFTRQSNKIATGTLEWRDFYSNASLGIYSVHCRMTKGTVLREHYHPDFHEYVYVVHGRVINWLDGEKSGKVIVPPECEGSDKSQNVMGWYHIPKGVRHRIQGLDENTHFISKFIRDDSVATR